MQVPKIPIKWTLKQWHGVVTHNPPQMMCQMCCTYSVVSVTVKMKILNKDKRKKKGDYHPEIIDLSIAK